MSTTEAQISVSTNLQKQDLSNLDISNLTPLSPEVISRQATINIGTIGHVAHGKSTVVKAISGVQTVRFKNELERNITIKLERLSPKKLQSLLRSPHLLREYETRLHRKLLQRRQAYSNITTTITSTTKKSLQNSRRSSRSSSVLYAQSISPSSGYCGSSIMSREGTRSLTPKITKRVTQTTATTLKRRRDSKDETGTPQQNKRTKVDSKMSAPDKMEKPKKGEYIVEAIESVEAVDSKPIFFVKWLHYPESDNTWESLENLNECKLLDQFADEYYNYYEETIAQITAELEADIEKDNIIYDVKQLKVTDLDAFEPLAQKVDLILLAQFRRARSKSQRQRDNIRARVLQGMLIKPYYYLRKQQLEDIAKFEKHMNEVENSGPLITVENNIDLDIIDRNFNYINENILGKGVPKQEEPPIGCKCINLTTGTDSAKADSDSNGTVAVAECNKHTKCCSRMAGHLFAYDKNGRLRIHPGEAIFECNSACACDKTCSNRIIQRGRQVKLGLFKTSNGRGWGVRAMQTIRKGEYVCEYLGEIITTEEANERGKVYDHIGRTYLFDLDYNMTAESTYTIDAAIYGNIAHFINHSCAPNLSVFPFWINNLDVNMPRLAFFSLRSIKVGEELSFDYIQADADAYQNLSEAARVECRCGAENCRRVLF